MKVTINQVRSVLVLLLSINQSVGFSHTTSLLVQGDQGVLSAPETGFDRELRRIKLPRPEFHGIQSPTPYVTDDTNIPEMNDLRAAMIKAGKSEAETEAVVLRVFTERRKIQKFEEKWEEWKLSRRRIAEQAETEADKRPPEFPTIDVGQELPEEFADYLRATVTWRNPGVKDKSGAREAWERILSAPREKRYYRSTWAAYMLGKSWEKEAPEKAIQCYQQVRALARGGFADSSGLAAASFGWEARIYLNQTNYERAMELYLEQLSTGDASAEASLRFVTRRLLLADTNLFPTLMRNPRVSRVITGYIISGFARTSTAESVSAWLSVAKDSLLIELEVTEELALAAYQIEDWETAEYWSRLSGSSPTAQWLQAKLFLRSGKITEALALLNKVQRNFSKKSTPTNEPIQLKDGLTVSRTDAFEQIRGELGVIHLARSNYVESLDWFMRGGFWKDAAYVAERVLTLDELKLYVDRHWPEKDKQEEDKSDEAGKELSRDLRYVLARRLTRENRGNEARGYYPVEWRRVFDALAESLSKGWNEKLPAEQRASGFLSAGWLLRTNGMELMGTELHPDCHIYGGNFETDLTASTRTNKDFTLFPASIDEQRRYVAHKADPEVRFHYRYQAAFLGWEAARLLPNNSEATARTLSVAGSWIKALSPETADLFYKSLVRRCRRTAIGYEAERIRWFPKFDEKGEVVRRRPGFESIRLLTSEASSPQQEFEPKPVPDEHPLSGIEFTLEAGDSLQRIAEAVTALGHPLTAQEILKANPGLDPARLMIGQKIFIPVRAR